MGLIFSRHYGDAPCKFSPLQLEIPNFASAKKWGAGPKLLINGTKKRGGSQNGVGVTTNIQKNYSLTEIKQISRKTGWGSHPTNQTVKSPIHPQTTDTDLNETHMVPVPIWP